MGSSPTPTPKSWFAAEFTRPALEKTRRSSKDLTASRTEGGYRPDARIILTAFKERNGHTNEKAADELGLSLATFKGILRTGKLSKKSKATVLEKMGAETFEDVALKFDHVTERVEVFQDLTESQGTFLAHFEGARVVKDTRIMLTAYPAPPPAPQFHREKLNKTIYNRLKQGDLVVQRIEQLNSLDRAVDLEHNIQQFKNEHYEVRIIPCTEFMFPYLQFSIFDDRSVLTGGFHVGDSQPHDPFMSYVGRRYADFYLRVWGRLDRFAIPFSTKKIAERLVIVVEELKKVKDEHGKQAYPDLDLGKLQALIAERKSYADQHPPRW